MKKTFAVLLPLLFVLYGCTSGSVTESATAAKTTAAAITTAAVEVLAPLETTATEATRTPETTAATEKMSVQPTVPVTTAPRVPETVTVPILMFHHVAETEGGDWAISAKNFRSKMEFLLANGFTPIDFDTLIAFVDGKGSLPAKPVCITFDDGYYSNLSRAHHIVTELEIPITVLIIGGAGRPARTEPNEYDGLRDKMSAEELCTMAKSPFIRLAPHTHALHIIGQDDGTQRINARPLAGESKAAYTKLFDADCAAIEEILAAAGEETHTVFSYPGGKSHAWSEAVLKNRGYRVTLTTDPVRVNKVTRGDPASLYLLGRLNVNDATTDKQLLRYLQKK